MTLLEYAEKVSPLPLMPWQKEFLKKYEEAVKDGKGTNFIPAAISGGQLLSIS